MAKKRSLPPDTPDYAVDRETLMQFFRPPVSQSTFYKLQKEGYIVPVESVSGRYRLNLSLIRLGLEAVSQLPDGPDENLEEEQALRLGLWLAAPDAIEAPAWLIDTEPSEGILSRASLLGLWHYRELKDITAPDERRAYVEGALDAAYLGRKR